MGGLCWQRCPVFHLSKPQDQSFPERKMEVEFFIDPFVFPTLPVAISGVGMRIWTRVVSDSSIPTALEGALEFFVER